jgi:hypothetical protein
MLTPALDMLPQELHARSMRSRYQGSLKAFAVILLALISFGLGVFFTQLRGVDEIACLDTTWGK